MCSSFNITLARIDNNVKLIYILTLTQFGTFWKLIYIYLPNRFKYIYYYPYLADTLKLIFLPNNGKINRTFTLPYTLCWGIIGGPQAGRYLPFRWDILPSLQRRSAHMQKRSCYLPLWSHHAMCIPNFWLSLKGK